MITTENYELYFLQYLENGLDEKGRREVEAFASQHPDLAEELELYAEAPRLTEDESVVYADKQSLKQSVSTVIPPTQVWWRWTAAAAVLAAVSIPLALTLWQPEPTVPQVAELRPEKVMPVQEHKVKVAEEQPLVVAKSVSKLKVKTPKSEETEEAAEIVNGNIAFTPEGIVVDPKPAIECYAATEPNEEQSEASSLLAIPDQMQYAEQSEMQPADESGRPTLREMALAELAERYRPSSEQITAFAYVGTRATIAWTNLAKAYNKFCEKIGYII